MTQAQVPTDWHPASWQARHAAQQPTYRDRAHLTNVLVQLSKLPPIVTTWEVENLKSQLAKAQRGEAFMLQGGDCAESFDECTSDNVVQKLKILLQMSLVMLVGLKKPIIRVGRMAGQYAKPRSADYETKDGVSLPSYRGDTINRPAFTAADREPDPTLMLRGYERAAMTLNFVRSLIDGGFADLHHPENWDLAFVGESALAADYRKLVQSVSDSLEFFEAISGEPMHETHRVEFFTSHEGLHLPYEQAQTRFLAHRRRWYN
ncbi:MAG: 3-deoxy-7-phosphoheptulonate synthase class II, partial [Lysobacterales bacterium]